MAAIDLLLSKVDEILPYHVRETEEWKRLHDIVERIEIFSSMRGVEKEFLDHDKEAIEDYVKNDLASDIGRYLLKEGAIMVRSEETEELKKFCMVNYRADIAVVMPKKKEEQIEEET